MNIFFTSDTHFNHANIIKYSNRPYSSVEEMNEDTIAKWNTTVKYDDIVYHLGDFAMGPAFLWPNFLKRLNGRKILIRANHDRSSKFMLKIGFNEVYKLTKWNDYTLIHRPFKTEEKVFCGHVHNHWVRLGDIINVGVDNWNFTPKAYEELIKSEQSNPQYKCQFCGKMLTYLENNSGHFYEKCIKSS